MNKFEFQLGVCQNVLKTVTAAIERGIPCEHIDCKNLYDELRKLQELLPESMSIFRNRLNNIIIPNIKLSDLEQINQFGQRIVFPRNGINPFVLGQVIATLHYITESIEPNNYNFWNEIHPQVIISSQKLFEDCHYAESVEAAFLEITVRIKNIIKAQTGEDVDGTAAMQKAFSVNNPIIQVADITTRTGKDIQQGIMELFTGSIRYIRNPKAHEKIIINKTEAINKLHFASLLLFEIDKSNL